jgi:hypothetical protein
MKSKPTLSKADRDIIVNDVIEALKPFIRKMHNAPIPVTIRMDKIMAPKNPLSFSEMAAQHDRLKK